MGLVALVSVPVGAAPVGAAPAGAAPFVDAWRAASVSGCLAQLEAGAPVDGAALGLAPAPDVTFGYDAPTRAWRDPAAPLVLGAATFEGGPGPRRLCEVLNARFLDATTVNAVYSSFLDWAEAVRDGGRYSFVATRYDDDWLTGIASLRSTFATPRGRGLEVTFVAQPAEGRVSFSAVETMPGEGE